MRRAGLSALWNAQESGVDVSDFKAYTPGMWFTLVAKKAKERGLKVKRHFAYYHPDGLLLELTTLVAASRIVWDADLLYTEDSARFIDMELDHVARTK